MKAASPCANQCLTSGQSRPALGETRTIEHEYRATEVEFNVATDKPSVAVVKNTPATRQRIRPSVDSTPTSGDGIGTLIECIRAMFEAVSTSHRCLAAKLARNANGHE